jgi:hypothetical protein
VVEQGTHKPLVASSNLALGTRSALRGGSLVWTREKTGCCGDAWRSLLQCSPEPDAMGRQGARWRLVAVSGDRKIRMRFEWCIGSHLSAQSTEPNESEGGRGVNVGALASQNEWCRMAE